MNSRLREVFEKAEQLPEVKQEELAARWEAELEDARWEASFADPRSARALDALVRRAKDQIARGEVYDTPRDAE